MEKNNNGSAERHEHLFPVDCSLRKIAIAADWLRGTSRKG
jgi:hypothetical protein